MEPLPAAELLALWERGVASTPAARAVHVLAAAGVADVAGLPAGARDALLLELYATGSGPGYDAVASCPVCGELLDVRLDLAALAAAAVPNRIGAAAALTVEGHVVDFRLPAAGDLARLKPADDADRAADALFDACVVSARCHDGTAVAAVDLPAEVRDAVEAAMAEADPGAEILLSLTCPACDERWTATLDPSTVVWEQVDDAARRVAAEVSALAGRHGWGERDVLAMSPARRRLYLEAAAR